MRVPTLTCSQCGSFRVTKNTAGSIICEDCNTKLTKQGNTLKEDLDQAWRRKLYEQDKLAAERAKLKHGIDE